MKTMEPIERPPRREAWILEGTYTEDDLRAFTGFLAKRVAGSKIWALGLFALMPLLWSGNLRASWPWMAPIAAGLVGFMVLLRFVILPNRLYKEACKLPGVFEPRRITIDDQEVRNASAAGGHTFGLEAVQEVVATPDHLFVMVSAKQGIPIPRTWLTEVSQAEPLTARLLSRRGAGKV